MTEDPREHAGCLPVFIVGRARSGTTWLANQLCQHPGIAGLQHAEHFGIHESFYFTHVYGRYGDLNVATNYVEFVEAVSASDYFRLAGATKEFLYSLWPTTYEGVFRAVMDRLAAARGATVWLEKTPAHTLVLDRIAGLFPDARFIGTLRDVQATVASHVALTAKKRPEKTSTEKRRRRLIIRAAVGWVYYNRVLEEFAATSERMLLVRFSDMKSDLERVLRQVTGFLGVDFRPVLLDRAYEPNTSFKSEGHRQGVLTEKEKGLIRRYVWLARRFPLAWAKWLCRRRNKGRRHTLPPYFYKFMPLVRKVDYGGLGAPPPLGDTNDGGRGRGI